MEAFSIVIFFENRKISLLFPILLDGYGLTVAPSTGAWIETLSNNHAKQLLQVAPSTGAWIETVPIVPTGTGSQRSPPPRGRGLKPK